MKKIIYAHCLACIENRIACIGEEISAAQDDANAETKSSAGDKHETGRAMAQLEVEKLMYRLAELQRSMVQLQRLKDVGASASICPGSLITTSNGMFYISVSMGALEVQGLTFMVVSPESPIGQELLGKQKNDVVVWNGVDHLIEKVE